MPVRPPTSQSVAVAVFVDPAPGTARPPGPDAVHGGAVRRGTVRRGAVRLPVSRRYLAARGLNAVVTVWAVLTIVFFALHLTGDPAALMVAPDAPAGDVERLRHAMGFDRPPVVQYLVFLGQAATGHYPDSIRYGGSSLDVVLTHLPESLLLGAAGLLGGIVLGVAAGSLAAFGSRSGLRRVPVSVLTALEAVPSFFLSVVLIAVFAIAWPVLPMAGHDTPSGLVLPAVVISCALAAPVGRIFRTSVLESLEADHVRLARAKGISARRVTWRHVVLNSLTPVVNVLGVQAGVVFGGAVVTETVFGWPGVGQLATSAIGNRDYPVVLTAVAALGIGFVVTNLAVDVLGALLDPRGGRR